MQQNLGVRCILCPISLGYSLELMQKLASWRMKVGRDGRKIWRLATYTSFGKYEENGKRDAWES